MSYIAVQDPEQDEIVEIPVETGDEAVLLSSLTAQFASAIGLKYKNPDTGAMRGLRVEDGKIFPPQDGWILDMTYVAVFPKPEVSSAKENTKRKIDEAESGDADNSGSNSKLKRVDRANTSRKCFDLIVLGLPYKTTEDELREHFEQFGAVVVSQVKKDTKSGKSKGFGFVRMGEWESQQKVLAKRHFIEGRWCDVKIPSSREGDSGMAPLSRKVFVGRIPESITVDDLRDFFEKHGDVTDVFIPKPFRAFAFVTFADGDVAQNLCGEDLVINGSSVYVSNATPKHSQQQSNNNGPYESQQVMSSWGPGGGGSRGSGKFMKTSGGGGMPPPSRDYGYGGGPPQRDYGGPNMNDGWNGGGGSGMNGGSNGYSPPPYGQPTQQHRPGPVPMSHGPPPPIQYSGVPVRHIHSDYGGEITMAHTPPPPMMPPRPPLHHMGPPVTVGMPPPIPSTVATGTSQATVGMGQLNLGNIPNILATVQGALLNALSAYPVQQNTAPVTTGNPVADLSAILASLSSGNQPAVSVGPPGHPPPVSGVSAPPNVAVPPTSMQAGPPFPACNPAVSGAAFWPPVSNVNSGAPNSGPQDGSSGVWQ